MRACASAGPTAQGSPPSLLSHSLVSGFSAIFLNDSDQHPRQRRRAELTAELIDSAAEAVVHVETEGQTRTQRLLWSVMLGDLVSLHLAAANGVDPEPVAVIEELKRELGKA